MALIQLLVISVILVPAPKPARDGWTGQMVMLKRSGVPFKSANPNEMLAGNLMMIEYRVLKDMGEQLLVAENGKEVIASKLDLVPHAEAVAYFSELIEKQPNDATAFAFRGWAWKQQKSIDNALKDYAKAIELAPNQCAWRNNRALIWIEKKDYDKAIADYDESLKLFPNYALAYRNRGNCLLKKKEYAKALADFRKSVDLGPEIPFAQNNLARLLATCPDEKIRDGEKARDAAKKANELADWKNGSFLDTLAAAYAELGQFDDAVKYQEKAFTDPYFVKDKDTANEARARLRLYREKKPYRDEEK
jgi:tetratricopeptide (TPR) repeat protein